ncbi:MAG: MFS transporter, partial [Phycisphaeraceae bacterium]|nr:MFS transporter [Phycisphaeraceae bacterium]
MENSNDKKLFWACFIALIATAFGFIVRAMIMDTWAAEYGLSETQKGEIFGVGLWPFAISIVLFSLVIDKIGYGTAMVFAFVCHVVSAVITIFAPKHFDPYWSLYLGNFIVALGNGTVEAVINPVVATMFKKEKTKWLNILHAGWPGGLVIGGIIAIAMGAAAWEWKVGLIFIPVAIYGLMMITCKFPVSERVAAGVPYREMLKEFGVGGALIVNFLMFSEVGRIFAFPTALTWGLIIGLTIAFGAYIKFAVGRPLFIFLLLIMVPLATTELGTDSWITSLMGPAMKEIGLAAGWVLVYTSFIMMVLRFFAGPIVHRISPLGLLATSAAVAAIGLILLSQVEAAIMILLAATVYGFGKTFFWPTMLGVVAEQSPKGGALTLNATGGVGMLGVGVVGAVFLGYIQDTSIESHLKEDKPKLHAKVVTETDWVFGKIDAVNPDKVTELTPLVSGLKAIENNVKAKLKEELGEDPTEAQLKSKLAENEFYQKRLKLEQFREKAAEEAAADQQVTDIAKEVEKILAQNSEYQAIVESDAFKKQVEIDSTIGKTTAQAKKAALATVAIFPGIMLACYLVLIVYFKSKGGYKAIDLDESGQETAQHPVEHA